MSDFKRKKQDQFEREHPMLTDTEKKKNKHKEYKHQHVRDMFNNWKRWDRKN